MVLAIVSVLVTVTLPMAETVVQRRHESALRQTLRDVRTAIDRFHADVEAEVLPADGDGVSADGYPASLEFMVEGVPDTDGETRRYLRALPRNPFVPRDLPIEEQWRILGYRDPPDALVWNGEDVYDLAPKTDKTALDGSEIATW